MQVVLETPRALTRLMRSLSDRITIVPAGSDLPDFDVACPVTELSKPFATSTPPIPAKVPYLHPDQDEVLAWRQRLSALPRPWVGLAWAGSTVLPQDHLRSIAPHLLAPLFDAAPVSFISLQKERRDGAPRALRLTDWTEDFHDMAATAALIANLDLVIGIDSSMIHLAGALARPVWMLNRYQTDWRWMLNREDSPWYPTMRIFRQAEPHDWTPVLARVRRDLQAFGATG